MIRADEPRRRMGAPIAAQIVALLIAGVALGQIVTLLIVLLGPPPRPPVYRLSEIADAFRGRAVKPLDGRTLVRTIGQPPAPDVEIGPSREPVEASRSDLAHLLGVPPDRLRLVVERPWRRAWLFPPMGPPGHPPGPPPGQGPESFREHWPGPSERFQGIDRASLVFGDFKAAMRRPDGAWIVVAPSPGPFLDIWQARLILWFLICLAVLAPAGFLFARRLVAPIGAFARAADRLGRDPGAPQMELSGPAEIGVAASAFNEMQARLKRYVDDRTSMIGAISHDLRTPLTRIRFKMEAAPADLRGSVSGDLDQMEAMIAAVIAFTRDASHTQDRTRLDLLSVLECVVDDARATGFENELTSEGAPTVEGDALALQRLFANLVDNAVQYGLRARVKLYAEGRTAVVEIADDGPGLPSGELERVFEPFYRLEPSRNRTTGGIGLGLSVARSIARGHGGDVVLSSDATGATATVRLPIAS
jgi:two-component system OmpR family sensor kinase